LQAAAAHLPRLCFQQQLLLQLLHPAGLLLLLLHAIAVVWSGGRLHQLARLPLLLLLCLLQLLLVAPPSSSRLDSR
jgi:hypothetical protein